MRTVNYESDRWANLLLELLDTIIGRVEATEDKLPNRQNLVAFTCVCRKWRAVVKGIVKPASTRSITFPSCLKQPHYLSDFVILVGELRNTMSGDWSLGTSDTKGNEESVDGWEFMLSPKELFPDFASNPSTRGDTDLDTKSFFYKETQA